MVRTVAVLRNNKPIAHGTINITNVPITLKKVTDDDYNVLVEEREFIEDPFQNARAVVTTVKVDSAAASSGQWSQGVDRLMQALEAVAWLYNCNKL